MIQHKAKTPLNQILVMLLIKRGILYIIFGDGTKQSKGILGIRQIGIIRGKSIFSDKFRKGLFQIVIDVIILQPFYHIFIHRCVVNPVDLPEQHQLLQTVLWILHTNIIQ